jgi:Fe-S cluster assembly protein SufD
VPRFTPDAASRLPGPAWLRTRRAEAAERFTAGVLPSSEEEVWRYSRIAELDLERFRPVLDPTEIPSGADVAAAVADAVGTRAALVVVRDGRLVHVELDAEVAARGLQVGRLSDLDAGGQALGAVAAAPDALGELHDAFALDPVLVRVPAGVVVPDPVVVVHWTGLEGAATFPRLVVEVGEDSEVTVYDHHGSAEVAALTLPVVELAVEPAGRLRYAGAQVVGSRVWQLGHQASRTDRDATIQLAMVALGGDYARLRIDAALAGRGASGSMQAVYFGEGTQMHDFRTVQDHRAPATTSDLLFKGAVQGTSHAVYSGLIHIAKEASGVNAFQTNRNITLSEGAWAESVPNLEIENNDVRCSHASAVGPVDADQRFYLESRGVPTPVAERLIVLGFFDEVLDRLPVPGALGPLRAEVAAKLARRERAA